jgi:fibronectin-binding autotransporter adhesin
MIIQLDGPGNVYWNASAPNVYVANSAINSPVVINAGALVLEGNNPKLSGQGFTLGGTFEFNAPSQVQTLTGIFAGAGTNIIAGGTLTLSGASTYTGDTVLNGGEVIVYGAETAGTSGPLGVGTIDFNGGTLGFSVNNTFDYSSRFNPGAGQAYSFDTGGQNVTLAGALASGGGTLTKLGSGTLTLSGANTYGGATTISAGKLEIQGPAGSGSITVANSTTLGVTENGPQITPASLTVGTTSSATLEFNNLSSTTTPQIAAGTISAGGPITVNVQSGSFDTGKSYPLFSWTTGSAPAVTLGTLVGAGGNLSTNGNTIQLNVTSLAYVWSGLNNDNWDLTTANNWKVNGVSQLFANGGTGLFDDTVTTANTNITLNSAVSPASATINSSVKPYSITSSGANLIAGTGGLTKNGATTLTLSGGVNTYTGPTTVSGGVLSVGALADGGSASDIGAANNAAASLVINSGTLQYTGGGASSDHLFTLGTAGATIDNEGGTLTFVNPGPVALSGAGARTLNLTGSDTSGDVLAAALADNGGATAVAKSGAGTWILTGTNKYSGGTTIHSGILQVDQGGTNGTLGTGPVVNNATLDFNRADTLTVSGAISGTGSVIDDGTGTLILNGNNAYTGGTTVNNGILQVGNGGPGGTAILPSTTTALSSLTAPRP